MTYDVLVLGTGPAGLSAAVTARGRGKSVAVMGAPPEDSPLARAPEIDNYLGLPGMSGGEMLARFEEHARRAGAEFVRGRVVSLLTWESSVMATVGSQVYQGRALILAPGVVRQNKYPGEEALLGRGVSYCATCDGMLYRGKAVVVAGRSPEAPAEANYLRSIGCKVTYVAPVRPEGLDEEIPFVPGNRLTVLGEGAVTGVETGGQTIPCAGVFILRPAVAPADLLPGLTVENGAIRTDRFMATNLPGVFAAGDCTGLPHQISKAVGEGLTAALTACRYLDEKQKRA